MVADIDTGSFLVVLLVLAVLAVAGVLWVRKGGTSVPPAQPAPEALSPSTGGIKGSTDAELLVLVDTAADRSQKVAAADELRRRGLVDLQTEETMAWRKVEEEAVRRLRTQRFDDRMRRLAAAGGRGAAGEQPPALPQPVRRELRTPPAAATAQEIYVGNIPDGATAESFAAEMERLLGYRPTRVDFRGRFAFIAVPPEKDLDWVIRNIRGKEFGGRQLTADRPRSRGAAPAPVAQPAAGGDAAAATAAADTGA